MQLTLTITAGPREGEQVALREGYTMSVGSSDQASFVVAGDPDLAELHFRLECSASGCFLRHLEPTKRTLVNGSPIGACLVRHGDRIQAGSSVLEVSVEGAGAGVEKKKDAPPAVTPAGVTAPGGQAPAPDPRSAVDVCDGLDLSPEGKNQLAEHPRPEQFLEKLLTERLFRDAVQFMALWLLPEKAVRWTWLCLQEFHKPESAPERAAYEAAVSWVNDPTDEHREKAAAAAKLASMNGAGSFLAAAAGYTGGSLNPPGEPVIPPTPMFVGQTVIAALTLVATVDGEKSEAKRLPRFIEIGKEVRKA